MQPNSTVFLSFEKKSQRLFNNYLTLSLLIKIGLGPYKFDVSFFNLSIFYENKISIILITELANYNILLWDLKLILKSNILRFLCIFFLLFLYNNKQF